MLALSPYAVSLASATASSSEPDPVDRDDRAERLLVAAGHLLGHAVQHRGLVEQRPDVGPRPATGENRCTVGLRVLDVANDRSPAGPSTAATPCPPTSPARRPRRRPRTRFRKRPRKSVGDGLVHDQPLHRHAELAGAVEAGPHGALGRAGRGWRRRRRTSSSCRRAPARRRPAAGRRPGPPAVRWRSSRCSRRSRSTARPRRPPIGPGPRTTCTHVLRAAPASTSSSTPSRAVSEVCGSGRSTTALPGQQRRHRVRDGQRQRVVPRRDDADHALGVAQLAALGQEREEPAAPARLAGSRLARRA